jgi:hypothetical protein
VYIFYTQEIDGRRSLTRSRMQFFYARSCSSVFYIHSHGIATELITDTIRDNFVMYVGHFYLHSSLITVIIYLWHFRGRCVQLSMVYVQNVTEF